MEGPATFTDAMRDSVFTGTFHRGLKHFWYLQIRLARRERLTA